MAKRGFGREISGENNPAHRRRGVRTSTELRSYADKMEALRGALLAAVKGIKTLPDQQISIDGNTKIDTAIEAATLFVINMQSSMLRKGLPVDDVKLPWVEPDTF